MYYISKGSCGAMRLRGVNEPHEGLKPPPACTPTYPHVSPPGPGARRGAPRTPAAASAASKKPVLVFASEISRTQTRPLL